MLGTYFYNNKKSLHITFNGKYSVVVIGEFDGYAAQDCSDFPIIIDEIPEIIPSLVLSTSSMLACDRRSIAGLKPHQFIEPNPSMFTFHDGSQLTSKLWLLMTLLFSN